MDLTYILSQILSTLDKSTPTTQRREEIRGLLHHLYQWLGDHRDLPLPNVVEAIDKSKVMPRHKWDCKCECKSKAEIDERQIELPNGETGEVGEQGI